MILSRLEWCIDFSIQNILSEVKPQNTYTYIFNEGNKQKKKYLAHRDNGSDVLAVVHMDTVIQEKEFAIGRNRIFASGLDDRLGLYTIMYHLPMMHGINLDILLCDNEENGMSTGRFWKDVVDKHYNWIVEFDRPGTDNVCYQYTSQDWCELWGLKFGIGSYTDIVELEEMGVKAINMGVGYYSGHSINSYMDPKFYTKQIERFSEFYNAYHSVKFDHHVIPYVWCDDETSTDYEFQNWLNTQLREEKIKPTQINSLTGLRNLWLQEKVNEDSASTENHA